jgi:hypothetical protein
MIFGTSERANEGRQHSSTLVRLEAFDAAVGVGAAGLDEALAGAEPLDRLGERSGAELRAVVGADLAQLPAGGLELAGDAVE